MRKRFKRTSVALLAALLISLCASASAFAGNEKMVMVSDDQVIFVSNYVKQEKVNESANLLTVTAPASIFFDGYKNYGYQGVTYYPEAQYKNGTLELGKGEEVEFSEKYYVIHEKDNEMPRYSTALPENFTGVYYMAASNYASVEKEGVYEISYSASPAAARESFFVQAIKGDGVQEQPSSEAVEKPEPQPAAAVPTASKVIVDGKEVSFEAYNIDGNNYFKLRDLAKAVNGSKKQFQVGWDEANNAISLKAHAAYTSVGGELEVSAAPAPQTALPTGSRILLDGEELDLTAYNINGNNYFKLRDIAEAFNIGVTWDGKANTVGIDTAIDYQEE